MMEQAIESRAESQDYRWVLGISIDPTEIDACLIRSHDCHISARRFNNNITGMHALKKWQEEMGCFPDRDTLACLVFAGYNMQAIVQYLLSFGISVWLRSPLHLKRHIRISGDEHPVTAARIANYALMNQDKAVPVTLEGLEVDKLKDLQANHRRIKKAILILESSTARIALRDEESAQMLEHLNLPALRGLKESLNELEEKISYYTFSLKLSLHQNASKSRGKGDK